MVQADVDLTADGSLGPAEPAGRARMQLPGHDRWITGTFFITSLVVMILAWWGATKAFHIQAYVLPTPAAVWHAGWGGVSAPWGPASLLYQFLITFKAAAFGFLIGSALGIVVGGAAAQFRIFERIVWPYIFGLQSMPKVAIIPLLMIWFGYGLTPRVLLVALLVFFPVVVNTLAGMNLTDRSLVNLFAANRATQFDYFVKLRLKSALPLVFAGLEIGIVQALLGAVVSEFVAAQTGIGSTILQFQAVSNTAGAFACLVILAVVGVILYAIIRVVRNRVVFWQKPASRSGR